MQFSTSTTIRFDCVFVKWLFPLGPFDENVSTLGSSVAIG